jgi:hypothetical protein
MLKESKNEWQSKLSRKQDEQKEVESDKKQKSWQSFQKGVKTKDKIETQILCNQHQS